MGRPAASPEQLEIERLHRCADLAASVLAALRTDGRHGRYGQHQQLKSFLAEDGVSFSNGDLQVALAMLEAAKLLVREPSALGQPRPGQLAETADKEPPIPESVRLGRLVIEVARPGGGRGPRCTRDEIAQRLIDADEDVDAATLTETLTRLVDCGRLHQAKQYDSGPISYALSSEIWAYEEVDDLEASIGAVMKSRTEEGYEDETELVQWLDQAGVPYGEKQLAMALGHLWRLGRLRERDRRGRAKVFEWIDAPIHIG
jgi:hypothetical protein